MRNGRLTGSFVLFLLLYSFPIVSGFAVTSVTLAPSTLSFGNQVEGTTSASKTATLQNVSTSTLTITKIAVTGPFAQSGGTCPLSPKTLAKGASCTILITFSPVSIGNLTGTLTVTDSATNSPQTSKLTGTGLAAVSVSPTALSFGKVPLGQTTAAQTVTLTNHQGVPLNFSNISASGNFAIASNTCGSGIGALSACTVGVTFTPTSTGARSGSLVFTDNALNSPQTVALSGTGTAPVLISIAVTPASSTIYIGTTEQLTATGTYSNNSTQNLTSTATWSTSPAGIATVTAGTVTGSAAGNTTVTATVSGISGSASLTVDEPFVQTGSLITARYEQTATLLTNGSVLVSGGIGPIPGPVGALGELASAELYNAGTGAFLSTGSLLTARVGHTATLLNNGNVLIAGGSGGAGELASSELYNAGSGSFSVTGNLNTARYEHTATILPNGQVLIAGGWDNGAILATAELYDPASGLFTYTGNLNAGRFDATATLLPDGQVLIAGGADANGAVGSAELYNPATGIFTPTGNLNVARSSATATLLNNGQVLIADGYNYLVGGPLSSAELYNPATGVFTPTGTLIETCYLGAAAQLPNGTVLIAGSVYNSASAEIYTPSPGTFSLSAPLLTPGYLQTATVLPNGYALIAGGHSNNSSAVLASAALYEAPTSAPNGLVSISITRGTANLTIGSSVHLIATGTFADNSTQQLSSVLWTAINPAVASVTNDATNSGVAYGIAAGSTTVTACAGTICGSTVVNVN